MQNPLIAFDASNVRSNVALKGTLNNVQRHISVDVDTRDAAFEMWRRNAWHCCRRCNIKRRFLLDRWKATT